MMGLHLIDHSIRSPFNFACSTNMVLASSARECCEVDDTHDHWMLSTTRVCINQTPGQRPPNGTGWLAGWLAEQGVGVRP
jgi:hypothetical protein